MPEFQFYLTWERYFTDLLGEISEEKYGFQYSKKKLHDFFLNEPNMKQVKEQLTDIVFEASEN